MTRILVLVVFVATGWAIQAHSKGPLFSPAPGSPVVVGEGSGRVVLVDVNGDGRLDLLTCHSADSEFYVRSLNLIDLNEDGKLDIVTANHRRNTFATLLGNGRGEFSPGPTTTIQSEEEKFSFVAGDMFGDLDGDKHLDLVIVSGEADFIAGSGRVRILRGDGKGAFKETPPTSLPILAAPRFVKLADVNGDQRLDIVTSHGNDQFSGTGQLSVLLNGGNDKFTPASGSPYNLGATPFAVAVADVNHDHRNDLVVATVNSITILLGGNDKFTRAPGSPFRAGPGAYHLALGDVNKDGKLDIAASSFEGNAVTVLLGR